LNSINISVKDISLDKEYHDILLTLHHTVTVEFSKREKEMKERIRYCIFIFIFYLNVIGN